MDNLKSCMEAVDQIKQNVTAANFKEEEMNLIGQVAAICTQLMMVCISISSHLDSQIVTLNKYASRKVRRNIITLLLFRHC